MKQGSKYHPLFDHLQKSQQPEVTLTFSKVEELLGCKLPASAWTKRAWWSNRDSKGALQASAWVNAGYHVESVDLEQQAVKFQKFTARYTIQRVGGKVVWTGDAIKALRHHLGMTQAAFAEDLGVRRQTVSEWENKVYEPDRSTLKHLEMVAAKNSFNL